MTLATFWRGFAQTSYQVTLLLEELTDMTVLRWWNLEVRSTSSSHFVSTATLEFHHSFPSSSCPATVWPDCLGKKSPTLVQNSKAGVVYTYLRITSEVRYFGKIFWEKMPKWWNLIQSGHAVNHEQNCVCSVQIRCVIECLIHGLLYNNKGKN
jgi:hypothetical protein